jgi:outer membrane protein OmpA-like peptidoglycan-associated protein
MRRMLVGGCSATLFAATLALGSSAVLAQAEEPRSSIWGEGEGRLCNVVIDTAGNPVIKNTGVGPVIHNQTFDCPEQIAAVEPAAPPAPLPESGTIYFEFDKYNLTPEAQAALDDIIFDIRDRELGGIVVNGHTDTVGTAEYNMNLSQERANTVATDLIQAGIPAQIVTTKAWGKTDLAVETPDQTPLQANRRVVMDFER